MQIKFYFILAYLLNQFSFSQEISGNYCTNSSNKSNVQLVKTCFIFKPDFTFEELSMHHNVWTAKGTFEIKKKILILHYEDPSLQNIDYKFKIITNKNNKLIIKGINIKAKYFLQKTTNI